MIGLYHKKIIPTKIDNFPELASLYISDFWKN